MIENPVRVSVIIPVYNGGKFLNQCLNAIFLSQSQSFEVIVVDDGSTDDSAEISRAKGALVLQTPRQSGPAAARNHGSKKALGDILLFVDADVVVKPDTIAKVAARFEQQPEIDALFGSYDNAPAEQNFLSQYKNLCHHFVHQHSSSEASTFWAGLGAIRRDVFFAVGGFDNQRFAIPSIEDIELGMRLRETGHRVLLDKDIQAKHLKKWEIISLLKTDIFARAVPWSKLLLTNQPMINDLNLKTADRASAMLVGISLCLLLFVFWQPYLLIVIAAVLLIILWLNRQLFYFFYRTKGLLFAAAAFPWQLLYFFYSGTAFVICWFRYALPKTLTLRRGES